MKISYDSIPALKYLRDNKLGNVIVRPEDRDAYFAFPDMFRILGEGFKKYSPKLKQNIFKVSEPFYKATVEAEAKLVVLYEDIIKSDAHKFNEDVVFVMGNHIVFYHIDFAANSNEMTIFYLVTSFGGEIYQFFIMDNSFEKGLVGWVNQATAKQYGVSREGLEAFLVGGTTCASVMCMFKRFADVETKVVVGKSKRRVGDPYRNDTDFPITHLDSKWFTNIVRSEGFAVRGHFRLQPKKINGEWTKELIWINDFEKHGYTSKARITNQNQ